MVEMRRLTGDLIEVFKTVKGFEDVESNNFYYVRQLPWSLFEVM